MDTEEIIGVLKEKSNPAYLAGMKRFGIENTRALGIPIPELRKLGKIIGKDHNRALGLWDTGFHEARILASLVDDPLLVTSGQFDNWVKDFNSWDICDQVCGNLFDRTAFAMDKALLYASSENEFTKRAGFVLMAEFAVHNKSEKDSFFIDLLPIIEREAWDGRNFVKKAINWALRQIGKRNQALNAAAIACAKRISLQNSKPAKWIASNALSELMEKTFR